jgi:hypothetical protein
MYDDGVGTSSFLPLALVGGIFGYGLKRNVLNLYKFVCRNYKSDEDEIFAFGFSRGGFTIDVLIGLIASQGLVTFGSEDELNWKAEEAYRTYRRQRSQSILNLETAVNSLRRYLHLLRGVISTNYLYNPSENILVKRIRFVGLWDTVGAYGLPLEGMTRALSKWFWPLDLPNRELSPIVQRACHALSLDDERITFHPILWNERGQRYEVPDADGKRYVASERISQVWFSGSHANVGGGYPDDSLSYVSLCWMLKESSISGLCFNSRPEADPDALVHAHTSRDRDGRIYDSRRGLHSFYRYGPRNLSDLCHMRFSRRSGQEVSIGVPKIHESVFQRICRGARSYAPIGIPSYYEVVTDEGHILKFGEHQYETLLQARARSRAQIRVWNLVWQRKLIAYVLGAALLVAFCFPMLVVSHRDIGELGFWQQLSSTLVRIVGAFVPYNALDYWINAYASYPIVIAFLVIVITMSHYVGKRLKVAIVDEMRSIWSRARLSQGNLKSHDWVLYRLRTHPFAVRTLLLARGASANLFAIAFILGGLYIPLTLINRLAFKIQEGTGMVCNEQRVSNEREEARPFPRKLPQNADLVRLEVGETKLAGVRNFTDGETETENLPDFETSKVCHSTGVWLDRNGTYSIQFQNTDNFKDGEIDASVAFYSVTPTSVKDKLLYVLASPLKREFLLPWFNVVARIGGKGMSYISLDPDPSGKYVIDTSFSASSEGELFLYVNDAVIGLPSLYEYFYRNNKGKTKIKISRLRK